MDKKPCVKDIDNDFIINNSKKFELLHQKKGIKLIDWETHIDDMIIIPVTINIYLDSNKLKINFIKYAKYLIDILNDGFSGNIKSIYKDTNTNANTNSNTNTIYNKEYIANILEKNKISNREHNANIIYNYINNQTDTNIRFYLHSIIFNDLFLEEEFEDNSTDKFMLKLEQKGFRLKDFHKKNLNINIMFFKCQTLGVSIFPWMKYIYNNIPGYMQVFLDYSTLHPELGNNNFNQSRTLIHEVGHVLGLRHTFNCTAESLQVYSIILGSIIAKKEILDKINNDNTEIINQNSSSPKSIQTNTNTNTNTDIIIKEEDVSYIKKKISHSKNNVQLYPDIPVQKEATIYNPFEKEKFPFYNNIPSNFCCFMDYSPDAVLTHFTYSQSRIMHYMIRLFKGYLIKNTDDLIKKLDNCDVHLFINFKNYKSTRKNKYSNKYYNKITYDKTNSFNYILSIEPEIKNYIYTNNQTAKL